MSTREKRERERRGRFIRERREALGLHQAELGAAADMTQPEISKLEAGLRDLSPSQLARIAGRLGVSAEELIAAAEARPPRASGGRSGEHQSSKSHV